MTVSEALRGPADADVLETLRQYARDYDWSDTAPTIEDPSSAADEIVAECARDCADPCRECSTALWAALIDSAEKENLRRAVEAVSS